MCTTIRHEIRHARKAWPGTLVDPCLFFGAACSGLFCQSTFILRLEKVLNTCSLNLPYWHYLHYL